MPTIFLLPTTYGALTLMSALCLFELPILKWDGKSSAGSAFLSLSCVLMFLSSLLFALKLRYAGFHPRQGGYARAGIVAFAAILGAAGVALYIVDFAVALGGSLADFFVVLGTDPLRIRALAEENRSIGTQVSYFGWISAAFSAHRLSGKQGSKFDAANVLITLLLNLAWIDRTRPLWIGVTCLLAYLVGSPQVKAGKVMRLLFLAFLGMITFFIGWVLITGKTGGQHEDDLAGAFLNLIHYITAGPAYFAYLVENIEPTWSLAHLLTPIYGLWSAVWGGPPPPSLILDIAWIPLSTNVGTGFEPFYMAAGWPGLVIAVIVYCFYFNAAAVFFLVRGGAVGTLGWSHLCFTSLLLFFVPKINSFSLWLILVLAFAFSFPRLSRVIEGGGRLSGRQRARG